MEEKLREILEERKNFIHTECLIDSLLRIDDEDIEYCKGCYYCNWSIGETTICKNTLDRKLRELL